MCRDCDVPGAQGDKHRVVDEVRPVGAVPGATFNSLLREAAIHQDAIADQFHLRQSLDCSLVRGALPYPRIDGLTGEQIGQRQLQLQPGYGLRGRHTGRHDFQARGRNRDRLAVCLNGELRDDKSAGPITPGAVIERAVRQQGAADLSKNLRARAGPQDQSAGHWQFLRQANRVQKCVKGDAISRFLADADHGGIKHGHRLLRRLRDNRWLRLHQHHERVLRIRGLCGGRQRCQGHGHTN